MITIAKDETRNEDLIDYYIITNDKHFNHNYYEIDKEKIIDYTINDHIVIIVYKIVNLDFDNSD